MRTITVTGSGISHIAPDAAVLRVAAVERGEGVAQAYEALATSASALVEVAQRHTQPTRITSTGVSLWPTSDNQGNRTGYEARHGYAVGCADLKVAGSLLAELAQRIGDSLVVDSVGLEVTDGSGASAEAREAAFTDARERALSLARMAGLGLGQVESIVESSGQGEVVPRVASKLAMSRDSVGLQPGVTAVSCSVTVVWTLT